jgi:hypothetical protein
MKSDRKKTRVKSARAAANTRRERFSLDELALQPWFLPRASRLAINSLIPPGYRRKLRAYFEDYGCMVCGKHTMYDTNGMCLHCSHLIRRRLKKSVRRRMTGRPDFRLDLVMGRRKELASKLLRPFAKSSSNDSIARRLNTACLRNPVDEALGFLTPGSSRDKFLDLPNLSPSEEGVLEKSIRDLPGTKGHSLDRSKL